MHVKVENNFIQSETFVKTGVMEAIETAWARWQRFHQRHCSTVERDVATLEAEFELVATGLTVSDVEVQMLFSEDVQGLTATLLPLPSALDDIESTTRYHFTLVAAATLLELHLMSFEMSKDQTTRLLSSKLTTDVLLPALRLERLAFLHPSVLRIFQAVLKTHNDQEAVLGLFTVTLKLLDDPGNDKVSYTSLCSLLRLLQQKDPSVDALKVCKMAIRDWRLRPKFVRAVVLHLVPALLKENDMHQQLLELVLDAWNPRETTKDPQELLYVVCAILSRSPREIIAAQKLQELVCFALRHSDALVRKQGLHILKVAFTHCVMDLESKQPKNSSDTQVLWVDTWQNFLTASEVIHMHHEQHLIEQGWPQIADLLTTNLVVFGGSCGQHDRRQWPVQLTFDWMQGLLLRLFTHDNPVVKRLFLSNFMEICIDGWRLCSKQSSASHAIHFDASFACSPSFRSFVLQDVLRACNDPVLYKSAHRARFQTLVAQFLASFLAFEIAKRVDMYVLNEFVAAVDEAIYGKDAVNHSPEALLSMLRVFQSPYLKQAAVYASTKTLLSNAAVNQLRVLLDVHAMRSFSQSMRTKMLSALTQALTGGFVKASVLPLSTLARVLCVYPIDVLTANNGETLLQYSSWIKGFSSLDDAFSFSEALASTLQRYLKPHVENSAEGELSSIQLAKLLLLTAEEDVGDLDSQYLEATPMRQIQVVLRAPLSALLPEVPQDELDSTRLVLLIAKLEKQVQKLMDNRPSSSLQGFTFKFERGNFYGGNVSCFYLLESAMQIVRNWLDNVSSAAARDTIQAHEEDLGATMKLVVSAVFLLTQLSIHQLTTVGDLRHMSRLDALCDEFKVVLTTAADRTVFDLALAAKCLSTVGANDAAVDSLTAFQTERLLPLLLALDTSRRFSGKYDARCAIRLAASKWVLLYQVVNSSSFISTNLLRATFDACVKALPTAGMDPSALIQTVNVLSLTLSQLASSLTNSESGLITINGLLEEVWIAYNDSKAKPDALTRAVVLCVFQPVFLLREELRLTMKHWIAEFLRFGSNHRPNVIFHLACLLCRTWRAHPVSALAFADELVELLLYREPLIDEKEQLTMDTSGSFQGYQGFSPPHQGQRAAITSHEWNRIVRLLVLSFLDDVAVGKSCSPKINNQALMNALLIRLIQLNVSLEWQKQHMLNSDIFGKKLRSWQALCVISAHVTKSQLTDVLPALQIALEVPQLPSVRYYMELFSMRIATNFPNEMCANVLFPMLNDANVMPQVGASLLLVSAYLVNAQLDKDCVDIDCGEMLETMLPWLNSSHGYTRVVAQYLLAKILPRHIHQLQMRCPETPGLCFLEGTARYLSTNKECKRLLRRQARQLEELHPDHEGSLLGMLSCGFFSEFGELLPRDEALRFSHQLKKAMNELYFQYQLENFPPQQKPDDASCSKAMGFTEPLTVQRKIHTAARLLEDSALPAAIRVDCTETRCSNILNTRQRPRQPIIMCASLVDKMPNLAGLARTCEIFQAEKLIVPNLRLAQQDATFANVSATAHKWMPLEEVRPRDGELHQAIARWKREGYTIVAVEQTGTSVSLAKYTLPRKMVLVLGCEKEGISLEVLQLVDVCVEIPQFGLIRSLNVHVCGSLVLWEYTKQQLLAGALESTL